MSKLATASPSDRRVGFAGSTFHVAPVRSGACIQQHGHDREIEGGPRHLADFGPRRAMHHGAPSLVAAGREMPPAGMEWDVERRIGLADRCYDLVGAGVEPVQIDA